MRYVIYILRFPNGMFYIGKAKDFVKRIEQHRYGKSNDKNLKSIIVFENGRLFVADVLYKAPSSLCDSDKQAWMDNAERIVIHNEARRVYNELTGQDTNYSDYSFAKKIVNQVMVNTQLY